MYTPYDQVFFFLKDQSEPSLRQDIITDIAIIGGGITGLSAAYACAQKGKAVVLLEKNYCGSGATGKSSGFITPNSELSFTDLIRHYDQQTAEVIWKHINQGVNTIQTMIETYQISCDYQQADTIILANNTSALKTLQTEHLNLSALGYETFFCTKSQLSTVITSDNYFGAMGYKGSFSITAYKYCNQFKKIIQKKGVTVYEETPVVNIQGNTITTDHARVKANTIIVCADRFTPHFTPLQKEVFQVQTFIILSQELTEQEIKTIFPDQPLLCWDTDFIYTYFRIHNKRLLVGGSNILSSFSYYEQHDNQKIYKKLSTYVQKKFPQVKLTFEYMWPGMIGISNDIAPIAGFDEYNKHIYYACAGTGLPVSTALGTYAAEKIIDNRSDLDVFFDPYRTQLIPYWMQNVIGKKNCFALNNAYNMFFK